MLKSPSSKLAQFFKTSRDRWKSKALLRRDKIKSLQVRIRDLSESRERWKRRAKSAEQGIRQTEEEKVHKV